MKKVIGFLIIFINCFYLGGYAQTDFITAFNQRVPITNLKITNNSVAYTSVKSGRDVLVAKTDVNSIEFKNGIKLVYENSKAKKIVSPQYNATINLNDGSFLTAFVDSIDSVSLYYHKYNTSVIVSLDINQILYITYVNSLREKFVSPASIKAQEKIASTTTSKAVESHKDRASYLGVTAGLSNAWFEEDGYAHTRSGRNGLLLGFNFERQFSKMTGINLGLRYEEKGSVYNGDSIKSTFNLPYLTLPISYRLYLTGKGNFNVYFDAGFYFGFLLAANIEVENSNSQTSETINLNDSEFKINHVDFGPTAGMGFKIKKEWYLFSVGVQYSPGFVTVRDQDYYTYPDYYSFATLNRNITCYLTFGIDIKSRKQARNKVKSIQ